MPYRVSRMPPRVRLAHSVAHLVSTSTAMAFITNRSEKHKSTSPIAIQVKKRQKTISNEEKSDIISRLEKGE